MKSGFKIFSAVLAAVVLISLFTPLIYRTNALPLDHPLLYHNDSSWAREDRSPSKSIDGEIFVPLTIFAQFNNTVVRVNNSLNTFVITKGEVFISVDATTHIATDQDDDIFFLKTYKLDYGERYVPLKTMCEHLGYSYESYTSELTGDTAIRIVDGTQKFEFTELLEKYNPHILKTQADTTQVYPEQNSGTTLYPQTGQLTDNNPDEPIKVLGNRILYLTFTDGINNNTDTILDTLLKYNYTGTFLISSQNITDYPATVARILSEGHKIGILPVAPEAYIDSQSLISELENTNNLLYRVYKIKTGTVMLNNTLYQSNNELVSDIQAGLLEEYGYSLWNTNVRRTDGIYLNDRAAQINIEEIWNNNTVVFNFGSNISTSVVLDKTLAFIYSNNNKCDLRLANSAYNPPF